MVPAKGEAEFTEEEIARRRDAAIRRALKTPPKPLKELVGKSERAQIQRESESEKRLNQRQKRLKLARDCDRTERGGDAIRRCL